jgi:pimeloyl-ACP methyl ester carboxylesterase
MGIAYTALGDGPCHLLFMHGWGGAGSGHSWGEVLKCLDLSGLRALIVDLRGHGKSEAVSSGFTLDRFASDMFAVADHAGAEQFMVVAFSMSGKWAQWMACTETERVVGQILLAPAPATEFPLPEEVKQHWLSVARSGDVERFAEMLRPLTKKPLSREILEKYFDDVRSTSQAALSNTLDICAKGAFVDRLSATRAATLLVAGSHDPMMPAEMLHREIVARIPGARLAKLDCGHEIPLEKPEETAALIEAFVAGRRQ